MTGLRSRIKPRALIIGAGRRAELLWQSLDEGFTGPNVDGFVALEAAAGAAGATPERLGGRVIGMPGDLAAYAREHRIQEIVVALDRAEAALPEQDLIRCRMSGVTVTDSASFLERVTGQVKLDQLESSWLIFSPGFRRSRLRDLAKRATDILYSVLGLLLTVPLLPILALLIRLDSRGPVFYRQRRVGLNGRTFEIYKFRSMRQDAEADGKARFARKSDDRVTRLGHFLRQSRLDELPQFFNVLKGDMSMVGPRPERPEFTADLAEKLPHYENRHSVRPGITGWAQIHYPYAVTLDDARRKLEYDLFYVKNHSLFLDLVTLLLTVRIAAGGIGAR
jgi:sugar transferase (PEP-CTERM system associated)